jgi:peptide deformylase
MRVLTIDNPEDKVILEKKVDFDTAAILDVDTEHLIEEMFKIADQPHVAGIAARQLGDFQRIIVVKLGGGKNASKLMINPKITRRSALMAPAREGCLSVPNRIYTVERPVSITVEFDDQNAKGVHLNLSGFDARCVCHEVDHLDGVLISKIGVQV